MTSAELAKELRIKESYMKSQWTTIVKRYAGYGITLVRIGRGAAAVFGIKGYGDDEIRFSAREYE